jgi:hypothetical protein
MRKAILFALLLISALSFSQAPQSLNYQAVARDASGNIITTAIGVRFEILQGSASGTLVYEETNTIIPSSAGIFTTGIGSGTPVSGTFSSINWANGPYFIQVAIDPTGGTSYSTVGTSQLLSVPYALYAQTAGNAQTFTAGSGITINSGTITNSSPNQTVNISGPGVTGSYPDYTITPVGALTASTGISIVSGTVTNTAPDQIVTISGAVGTYPNFTVTSTPATSLTSTGTSILISGTGPGFTIVPQPSLTLTGNQLSIADGNTVTLPTGTTYTSGVGISLGSGTVITNSLPDQTVTISNGVNITVSGTYPNFTVDATPSLSIASGSISISGGNSVALPAATPPTTVIAGTNVSVGGTGPTYTVNSTPTLSIGSGSISISGGNSVALPAATPPTTVLAGTNVTVGGAGPTFTVNAVPTLSLGGNVLSISGGNSVTLPGPPPSTSVTAGNNVIVNGSVPNFTVSSPTYSLNFSNSSTGNLTNGINSSAVSLPQPTLTVSGTNSNVISAGSNSITIATYTAVPGSGLLVGGAFPNFNLSTTSTGTAAPWNTLGNTGTNAGVNFLGTTDAQDLVFKTANNQRMRIYNSSGNVGIGNISTSQELLQVETGSNTAVSILSGTNSTLYFGNAGNHFLGAIKYDNTLSTMSFWTNNTADRIFIDPSGRVAIGNNFTVSELDVNGSLRLQGSRLFLGAVGGINSGYTGIYETNSDLRFAVGQAGAPSNPPFASGGNSYDAMTIDSPSGFVGMGTVSPAQNLHVVTNANNIGVAIEANLAGRSRLGFLPGGVDNGEIGYRNHLTFGTISSNNLVMTTEWMRLTSTGFLGIGTTTPGQKLHVFSTASDIAIFESSSASDNRIDITGPSGLWGTMGYAQFNNTFQFSSYGNIDVVLGTNNLSSINMYLKTNGNVGMGTNSPSSKLHVNGQITMTDGSQGAGKVLVSNTSGTATWKTGQIAFFCGTNPSATSIAYTAGQTATVVFASGTNPLAYNMGGAYTVATGMFTAPVSGVYQFDAVCVFAGATNGFCQLKLRHSSGNQIAEQEGFYNAVGQNWWSGNLAGTVHLNAGEKVYVEYYAGSAGGATLYQDKSSFSGHLVYQD